MPTRLTIRFVLAAWLFAALPLAGVLPAPGPASAAAPVDPTAIALTPGDLPPGFTAVPETTRVETLPNEIGIQYRSDLRRERTPENVLSGPIVVMQSITRIDRLIAPADLLATLSGKLVEEQGLAPVENAPTDGGTISLAKSDGVGALFAVGFVKNDTVIFTIWGGHHSVVDLPGLLELAGITSARYDRLVAQNELPAVSGATD